MNILLIRAEQFATVAVVMMSERKKKKKKRERHQSGCVGGWIDGGLSELVFQNYMQGWMDGSKESPVAEWEQNIKGLNYYHDNIIL